MKLYKINEGTYINTEEVVAIHFSEDGYSEIQEGWIVEYKGQYASEDYEPLKLTIEEGKRLIEFIGVIND